MVFQGSIKTIHLPTIFQVFYFSNKTGVLEVDLDELKYDLYFQNGSITDIETNFVKSEPFEVFLKANNPVYQKIKGHLKGKTSAQIADILKQNGSLKEEHLNDAIKKQLKELILDIVGVEKGKFQFIPKEESELKKYRRIKIDVQNILMESMSRAEDISNYLKKFSFQALVKKEMEIDPQNYSEYFASDAIQGEVKIIDIVKKSKYSLYDTFKTLEDFLNKKAISLLGDHKIHDEIMKEFPEEVEKLSHESEFFNEGLSYFHDGLYKQGIEEFNKVLSLFDNTVVYLYIALSHIYLSQLKSSLEILKKILEKEPNHPFIYLLLARIFFRLKKDDNAVKYLSDGIKKNPDNIPLLWEYANYFYKMKDIKKSQDMYRTILKLNPSNIDIYIKLGSIYLKEGNKELALEVWKKGQQLDPKNVVLQSNINALGKT